jgi:hypothetical protein
MEGAIYSKKRENYFSLGSAKFAQLRYRYSRIRVHLFHMGTGRVRYQFSVLRLKRRVPVLMRKAKMNLMVQKWQPVTGSLNSECLPESGIKRSGSLRHRDRGIHQVFMEVRMWQLTQLQTGAEFMNIQVRWGFWPLGTGTLSVLRLEVSVFRVYITTQFQITFARLLKVSLNSK